MNYPTIILVRHGETEWNQEGRYQGRFDSPLTLQGREQAKINAEKLKRAISSFDEIQIFASPLGRAKSTATIICGELGVDVSKIIFDDLLQEFSYGIFEGKTKDECREKYSHIFRAREEDKWSYQIEGGESYEMVTKRLKKWLKNVNSEKTVVIIAHEMINRAFRGLCRGLEHNETLRLRQDNSTVLLIKEGEEILLT